MARYSAELLAALRHRYEKTDEPMRALAAEFGIGISTLSALVEKGGWAKRSQRTRDCPPVLGLLAEAKALAEMPPILRDRATPAAYAPPPAVSAEAETAPPSAAAETAQLTPVERLEALVTHYIALEEVARAELERRPRTRGEAEHSARTLSTLTQTLRTLQSMKPASGVAAQDELTDDDDMPRDLDEFRLALARRIDAFVASRPVEADAACARFANPDDSE
jgi:hypothetical protein